MSSKTSLRNAAQRHFASRGRLTAIYRRFSLVQLTQGQYSLVVQCQDGTLHLFDLPKTTTASLTAEWPSYGADAGNTRSRLSGLPLQGPIPPELSQAGRAVRIGLIRPVPSEGDQDIVLESPSAAVVALDLYDVSGRRVRDVFHGAVQPGRTVLHWDGMLENGGRAPSGIYWFRMKSDGTSETRRIVMVR